MDAQVLNPSQSDNLSIQDDGRSCGVSFQTFVAARIYLKLFCVQQSRGGFNDDVRNYNSSPGIHAGKRYH
ncbi:MAG: hypothetical protein ACKVHE_28495 [Planctomycetales bacterium]